MSGPGGTLLLLPIIGMLIGVLINRYTGTNWLRHIAGTRRGQLTSGLVGIAGSFVGFEILTIIASDRPIGITMIAAGAGAAADPTIIAATAAGGILAALVHTIMPKATEHSH